MAGPKHPVPTEDQLNSECTRNDFLQISERVRYQEWKNSLGLSQVEIDDIEQRPANFFVGTKRWFTDALDKWKSKLNAEDPPLQATFFKLVKIADEIKDGEAKRVIHDICISHPPKLPATAPISPNSRAEKVLEQKQLPLRYCIAATDGNEVEVKDKLNGEVPDDAALGLVQWENRWDTTQFMELRIHFVNKEILKSEGWKYGGDEQLTASHILDWATNGWNKDGQKYPKLVNEKATKDQAQIRVEFSRVTISWSMVGANATKVPDDKPTMVLNLYNMTSQQQKSMVLHEFGHALGLDHEHQRSDFWDVLEELESEDESSHEGTQGARERKHRFIIGKERMKSGDNGNCALACCQHFRAVQGSQVACDKTEYDPDSIMHYWFDKNWLEPEYRKSKMLKKIKLTPKQLKVLEGVHKRDYHNGQLAIEPSPKDFEALNKAYSAPILVKREINQDVPAPPENVHQTGPAAHSEPDTIRQRQTHSQVKTKESKWDLLSARNAIVVLVAIIVGLVYTLYLRYFKNN